MDHIFDDLLEKKHPEEKEIATTCWKAWQDVWKELSDNLPGEDGIKTSPPSEADRLQKSRCVKSKANEFLTAFTRLAGGATDATFYVHVLVAHIPEFVAIYGNLSYYSAQGAEHLHHFSKDAARNHSSRQPGYRLVEILTNAEMLEYYSSLYPSPRMHRKGPATSATAEGAF